MLSLKKYYKEQNLSNCVLFGINRVSFYFLPLTSYDGGFCYHSKLLIKFLQDIRVNSLSNLIRNDNRVK